MQTITHKFKPKYEYIPDIGKIKDQVLFFDIETTGFTYRAANVYMIGVAYYKDEDWMLTQWLIEDLTEEKDLLSIFNNLIKEYKYLAHFNGTNFDIPFLQGKYRQYGIQHCLDDKEGIDLYQRIAPFKSLLGLRNCRQKQVESYMDEEREDPYNGGELINVFLDFLENKDEDTAKKLLLHNAEDVIGMLNIAPLLCLWHLFSDTFKVTKVYSETYHSVAAHLQKELFICFKLNVPLYKEFEFKYGGCMFKGNGENGIIRVPIHQGELKYFYANYKDYYYLPAEDTAVHKSVATYVDKSRREQAKASNCYTKLSSEYLPQWNIMVEPFFKTSFESKQTYFELTKELKTDRHFFSRYVTHIMEMMLINAKKREG